MICIYIYVYIYIYMYIYICIYIYIYITYTIYYLEQLYLYIYIIQSITISRTENIWVEYGFLSTDFHRSSCFGMMIPACLLPQVPPNTENDIMKMPVGLACSRQYHPPVTDA